MHLLTTNPYVIIIVLDFSKAFDTVRQRTLLDKIPQLNIDFESSYLLAISGRRSSLRLIIVERYCLNFVVQFPFISFRFDDPCEK